MYIYTYIETKSYLITDLFEVFYPIKDVCMRQMRLVYLGDPNSVNKERSWENKVLGK